MNMSPLSSFISKTTFLILAAGTGSPLTLLSTGLIKILAPKNLHNSYRMLIVRNLQLNFKTLFKKLLGWACRNLKAGIIRASGSVGANYIEANEALSDKDFVYRVKICRKESKESVYWLRLIHETNPEEFKGRNESSFYGSEWTNKDILINREWQVKVKSE